MFRVMVRVDRWIREKAADIAQSLTGRNHASSNLANGGRPPRRHLLMSSNNFHWAKLRCFIFWQSPAFARRDWCGIPKLFFGFVSLKYVSRLAAMQKCSTSFAV